MRKNIIITSILATLLITTTAFAQMGHHYDDDYGRGRHRGGHGYYDGRGCGGYGHYGYNGGRYDDRYLKAEQIEKIRSLREEYYIKSESLRREIYVQEQTIRAEMYKENPDQKVIDNAIENKSKNRVELEKLRTKLRIDIDKVVNQK